MTSFEPFLTHDFTVVFEPGIPEARRAIPFKEVDGLGQEIEVSTYFEANRPTVPIFTGKNRKFSNILLRRGEDADLYLPAWFQNTVLMMERQDYARSLAGGGGRFRLLRSVQIDVPFFDQEDGQKRFWRYRFDKCWPRALKWVPLSAMTSDILIQEVELVVGSIGGARSDNWPQIVPA